MEERNLDLQIGMSAEQWEQVARRAAAMGPDRGGYAWDDGAADPAAEPIHLFLRDDDSPNLWRHRLAREQHYGAADQEVARFHFNGGRPYAEVSPPAGVEEPAYLETEQSAMQRELETWTRGKWRELMEESGLHYDRGHLPQS